MATWRRALSVAGRLLSAGFLPPPWRASETPASPITPITPAVLVLAGAPRAAANRSMPRPHSAIVHERVASAGHSRPANRRQHARPAVSVSHSGHGRKAAPLCRQESAGGPCTRSPGRYHRRFAQATGRDRRGTGSQERPRHCPARSDDRRRRAQTGPHPAAGLEFVELLGRRGQRRQGPRRGRRHGQQRPGRPRLPVRQHRRLLGRQTRWPMARSRPTRNSPT